MIQKTYWCWRRFFSPFYFSSSGNLGLNQRLFYRSPRRSAPRVFRFSKRTTAYSAEGVDENVGSSKSGIIGCQKEQQAPLLWRIGNLACYSLLRSRDINKYSICSRRGVHLDSNWSANLFFAWAALVAKIPLKQCYSVRPGLSLIRSKASNATAASSVGSFFFRRSSIASPNGIHPRLCLFRR